MDESLQFDPFDLGEDVTPSEARAQLARGYYARALLLALHLGQVPLIAEILEGTPIAVAALVSPTVPHVFLPRLIDVIAARLQPMGAPVQLEFYTRWCLSLLQVRG
jgi:periodic tryptophan protein 2